MLVFFFALKQGPAGESLTELLDLAPIEIIFVPRFLVITVNSYIYSIIKTKTKKLWEQAIQNYRRLIATNLNQTLISST